jgi:hypothetical protein
MAVYCPFRGQDTTHKNASFQQFQKVLNHTEQAAIQKQIKVLPRSTFVKYIIPNPMGELKPEAKTVCDPPEAISHILPLSGCATNKFCAWAFIVCGRPQNCSYTENTANYKTYRWFYCSQRHLNVTSQEQHFISFGNLKQVVLFTPTTL